MKIILLHNANAGGGGHPSKEQILHQLEAAGLDVVYQTTREKGAKWTLLEPADAVIAAGGDGTVRKAALAISGRGIPLAILPLGTANNLAKFFGGFSLDADQFNNLEKARRVRLDVGMASSPWGKTPFIESAGAGLLARLMYDLSRSGLEKAPSVQEALAELRKLVEDCPAQTCNLTIDGRSFSENLLLVEAMNTAAIGPNLKLAPEADPGDGCLDFVILKEENRAAFADFLNDPEGKNPPLETVRGKTMTLEFEGPAHADDLTWPPEKPEKGPSATEAKILEVHLPGKPIELLVPG